MLNAFLLLISFSVQGPLHPIPTKDSALLPPSCVLYVEVPGIPKETWSSLLGWIGDQLAPRSPWISFFPAKVRKGLPILRSLLRGLPRNGIYQRLVDLGSRPFSLGLLRGPGGKVGDFEIFHQSSPRMAAYTARKLRNPLLPSTSLGKRVLFAGEPWVLEAFRVDWARQGREGSPSARALEVQAALPKAGGLRGFLDLAALRPVRRSGKTSLDPGAYLFFGSWEELAKRASGLSFRFWREGRGIRGRLRLTGVLEGMDEGTRSVLGVGEPPRLGAAPPVGCVLSMAFDRKIPAFLSSFERRFPRPYHQDLQGFLQQLELFFRGRKAEDLLGALQGPFRFLEMVPGEKAPALHRGGGRVRLGGTFFEGRWVDPKTRKMLVPALQVFALAANEQRKNRGRRRFLLHKEGDGEHGMLEASLKTPLRTRWKTLEDLYHPRFAWKGERVALGIGGAKIREALERPLRGGGFHEFYTLDCARLWEVVEELGPLLKAGISLNTQFPPSIVEKAKPLAGEMFKALGRLSLGLRWGARDALVSLDWRPGLGKGGVR